MPELYKEEAIKTVTWGKQWVSFDDEDTLKMKVDRAGERCLGGVMVWAISHDTRDAKYNKALAKVLGRKVISGSLDDDEKAADFVKKPYEQCRWTNCKEPCPKGWVHVGRSDPGARKNELMYDETACGGDGIHSFCCPPNYDIPICGCMRVYDTCRWGAYPECNTSPECPGDYYNWPMASSGSGSGALRCNDLKNDLGTPIIGVQMRNYCCNTKPGLRFIDCQVRRDFGPAPDGEDLAGYCRSGCPSDRVRVALDTAFHTYLVVREDDIDDISSYLLLRNILSETGSPVMLAQEVNIWNSAVRARYEFLQITYISSYIRDNWRLDWQGPSQMAIDILCEPLYWALRIKAFLTGDEDAVASIGNCTYAYCDEKGYCENLSDAVESADLKRRHAHLDYHFSHFTHSHHHHSRHILEARAREDIEIKDPDDPTERHRYRLEVPSVNVIAKKNPKNPLLDQVVEITHPDLCKASLVMLTAYRDPRIVALEVEHVLDKHILKDFMRDSVTGKLQSGATSKYGPIPVAFWDRMDDMNLELERGVPALPGGRTGDLGFVMNRAFECLGSAENDQIFMIVQKDINDAKNNVMQLHRTIAKRYLPFLLATAGKTKEEIEDDRSKVLSRIRAGFSVFRYMQKEETKDKLNKIVKDIRVQFKFAESVYNKKYPNEKVQLADYWIEWITDYYALVSKKFRENMLAMATEVREEVKGIKDDWAKNMRGYMQAFEKQAKNEALTLIDTSGFSKDDDTEMGGT
ncbi:hypothetical protein FOC4_g10001062 [Fusarium odoratissimum]|uniref:GH18 domain-containing protein n=1 Tax=Fusarium oxysporum f. sp. cubense (strain race 4) TaxID=2502994 RepID=N1RBY7_FUSC4|nr:hypothetical protein FOC4_g10001062 [Fusarium odoratissimum]